MSVILITGASSGIGHVLVLHLLQQGHTVWGVARNGEKLKQLASDSGSEKFFFSVCDVAKTDDLMNLKRQMDAKGIQPDILILNAGVTSNSPVENQHTNFEGVVNSWNAFKTDIQRCNGIVVVSGSLFALVPAPFNPSYSQSKLDALNFLKTISGEPENKRVKFKYFVLGPVNTQPYNRQAWWKSLFIPTPQTTAIHMAKHLGSPGLINIFPFSSKAMIMLKAILPQVAMNRLITFLKR